MKKKLGVVQLMSCTAVLLLACMLFTPARGPLVFQPDELPAAQAGISYEARIIISGNTTPAGAFSVSEGTLPAGLQLETLEGENAARIFGTPTRAGAYKFTIFVWCYGTNVSGQTGEKEYTLVVK
jgi:hypothetical protein